MNIAIGTIIGAVITALANSRSEKRRRAENSASQKREAVHRFLEAAHKCIQHAATIPGARETAEESSKGLNIAANYQLGKHAKMLFTAATFSGMGDFVSLRIARDMVRSTWGKDALTSIVIETADDIQNAYAASLERTPRDEVSSKIEGVNRSLGTIVSMAHREIS